MYHSGVSPFGGYATTFPPQAGALWMLSHGAMSLQESIETYSAPLNRGKSGAARIGGGERSEPIRRMLFMPYDTESQSRNADFISIAAERQSATLGAKGPVKLKNPPAAGRSILRTFPLNLLNPLNPGAEGA